MIYYHRLGLFRLETDELPVHVVFVQYQWLLKSSLLTLIVKWPDNYDQTRGCSFSLLLQTLALEKYPAPQIVHTILFHPNTMWKNAIIIILLLLL